MNGSPPTVIAPTLGDILAAALTRVPSREEEEQRIAAQAQFVSAWQIADDLAPLLGVQPSDVFDAFTHIPDNMLGLLLSPEGWGALAEYASGILGKPSPHYHPTIH